MSDGDRSTGLPSGQLPINFALQRVRLGGDKKKLSVNSTSLRRKIKITGWRVDKTADSRVPTEEQAVDLNTPRSAIYSPATVATPAKASSREVGMNRLVQKSTSRFMLNQLFDRLSAKQSSDL